MMDFLHEIIQKLVEDRTDDLRKIGVANQSFDEILDYVMSLGKNPKAFDDVFDKNNGWMTGFALGSRIRRLEHQKLRVSFMDREVFRVRGKINAQALRVKVQPDNPRSAQLKGFLINIYFNAPAEVKSSPKTYNKWLANNLEDILQDPSVRSSYVHEFVHVLDFKRMEPTYLLKRTNDKIRDQEIQQSTGVPRNFQKYANDPLELNAYFMQAMSDVQMALKNAETVEEKQKILGSTPQEFAQQFMSIYLKKQARKNLTPDNQERLLKRAATSWELLRQMQ
jgi:hypothetical protein